MSKRDEQIARMQGLMTYGIASTPKKNPVTESIEGPDGKIYAIIREGSRFYIKSAPKGSELVTESFNYIGGFMNKKSNEFSSYNQASKNLELKLRSLNETYGVNKTVELLNPDKKESLMVEMTDTMKASIARYRQIMANTAGIMNESATISASNTGVPEAPKTTGFSPKLGEPFNDAAKPELDKDLKATANDPEKQGEPFGNKEKTEENKPAQYVPSGSVANQHPSGGKVVRVNENEDYEECIEECEEWGSCGIPEVGGVGEVGDDDPFVEPVNEDVETPVGFADEDPFAEGEEGEEVDDIDLDDIDSTLDDDSDFEDSDIDDIDDIDTEDDIDAEDDIDNEDNEDVDVASNENEIELLRKEIADLRDLITKLVGEDADAIGDEAVNDGEMEDDFDNNYIQESANFSFPVNVRTDELSDKRGRYGIASILKDMLAQRGGNSNDEKIIGIIRGKLMQILTCDYELRACIKNNHLDDDDWSEIITTMESNTGQITRLLNNISFLTPEDRVLLDRRAEKLNSYVAKYSKYYDENINPDAQYTPVEDEEDDYPEEPDVNVDDIGFEDDIKPTETEMDADAWAGAKDFEEPSDFEDLNDMDDMFDSVKPRKINENGTKLNVFGKHPGYRKKVMTLPQTGSDKEGNTRDWNDDSVYSEEPFGNKIGTSSPYEDIVEKSVNAIMESLKKKL
jgi:hypothetical protein